MDVFFAILAVLSFIICTAIIVDKTIFDYRFKKVKMGMTGKEVQAACRYKINPESIKILSDKNGYNGYEAIIKSYLTIFKYRLIFKKDGKLLVKQRI